MRKLTDKDVAMLQPHDDKKFLYRYESNPCEMSYTPLLREFQILSETKQGFWVEYLGNKKFVYKNAKSSYANETKVEAMYSLLKRKIRYKRILKQRLKIADQQLTSAQSAYHRLNAEYILNLN